MSKNTYVRINKCIYWPAAATKNKKKAVAMGIMRTMGRRNGGGNSKENGGETNLDVIAGGEGTEGQDRIGGEWRKEKEGMGLGNLGTWGELFTFFFFFGEARPEPEPERN